VLSRRTRCQLSIGLTSASARTLGAVVALFFVNGLTFANQIPPEPQTPEGARNFTPIANADQGENFTLAQNEPARVRIALRLTPWKMTVATTQDGRQQSVHVRQQAIQQTLRARLDRVNHFHFGDWHVQTTPVRWSRATKRYAVRLDSSRRYGAFGQLEESIGSVEVAGVLHPEKERVFVLHAATTRSFRDKFGNPMLDIDVGHGAARSPETPVLSGSSVTPKG